MEVTVFRISNSSLWSSYEDISHQLFPLPPVTVTDLKSAPPPCLPHKSVSSWAFKSSLNADNIHYLSCRSILFLGSFGFRCLCPAVSLSLKSSHGQTNTGGLRLLPGHTRGLSKGSRNVAHESGWSLRFCAYFAWKLCSKGRDPSQRALHCGGCSGILMDAESVIRKFYAGSLLIYEHEFKLRHLFCWLKWHLSLCSALILTCKCLDQRSSMF